MKSVYYSATTDYWGHLNKTGQSDCRTRTMNFKQSWLNQSLVDGKQQLKPKSLELFTVLIIMWSDWPVLSNPGNSSRTVIADFKVVCLVFFLCMISPLQVNCQIALAETMLVCPIFKTVYIHLQMFWKETQHFGISDKVIIAMANGKMFSSYCSSLDCNLVLLILFFFSILQHFLSVSLLHCEYCKYCKYC